MKEIQSYIFVHNQNIILDFEREAKFKNLNKYKYVFLGNNEIDKILNLNNVIICKNLKFNLESFPQLTSFSGWYALWKNRLIDNEYINLFEYDVNVSNDIEEKIKKEIKNDCKIIGFIPHNIFSIDYLGKKIYCEEILNSIRKNYNIDCEEFIKKFSNDPYAKNLKPMEFIKLNGIGEKFWGLVKTNIPIGHTFCYDGNCYEFTGKVGDKNNNQIIVGENATKPSDFFNCSMTSNHTFETNTFYEYMSWIDPLIEDFKNSKYAGHQAERSISLFYLINNIKFSIINDVLYHFQFDSHKTQGVEEEKFLKNYLKLINNI